MASSLDPEERPPLRARAPLALPALWSIAGVWASQELTGLPVPALVSLVALGLALGGRGAAVAWVATAALWGTLGWSPSPGKLPRLDLRRPLALEGETAGCWSRSREAWEARLRVARVAQGEHVVPVHWRVRLFLPGDESPPRCGARLRVRGYLREPHEYWNRPRVRVGGWSLYLKSRLLLEETQPPGPLGWAASELRARILFDHGEPVGNGSTGGADGERPGLRLMRGLLLGEAQAVPGHWREGFRRVGLSHLLAVSGLHVGMVGGLVVLLAVRAPRTLRLLAALGACGAYALLVGPRPSLLRAVLMAMLGGVALLLRRPPQPLNALGAAVLALLADDPSWLGELGFQLSVAATAGILLLAPVFTRWLESMPLRPPSWLAAALAVTMAAQLATLPWGVAAFHRWSPMAPLANLVAIPWAALALSTSLLWAAARLAWPPLASLLESALDLLAAPCEWIAGLSPSAWWSVPMVAPWPLAVVVTGLWVTVVLRPGSLVWWLPRVAAGILLMAWSFAPPRPEGVEVVFFDVGQGDGILLRDGSEALLMDAGGWSDPGFGARVMLPALAGLGVRRLTALAVSHAHRDHCGGIADLARELPARELWVADRLEGSSCGEQLASVEGLVWRVLEAGDELALGRWRFQVLGPPEGAGGSPNDRSLVLRAEALGRTVLLTGDTEARGERLLVRLRRERLAADLLKVGHHGSRTSTTAELLGATSPRLAVISAGRNNRHNHPSAQVVAALARRRIPLLRTDRHGMVRVRWQGPEHWRIETEGP